MAKARVIAVRRKEHHAQAQENQCNDENPESSGEKQVLSCDEKQHSVHLPQGNEKDTTALSEKELAAYKAVDKGYTSFEEQRALAARRSSGPARQVSVSLRNTTSIKERMAALKAKRRREEFPKAKLQRNQFHLPRKSILSIALLLGLRQRLQFLRKKTASK